MSTDTTACGIELYAIMPGICALCKYEVCFVGGGYVPPFTVPSDEPEQTQEPAECKVPPFSDAGVDPANERYGDLEWKAQHAAEEARQERAAFASDPDYRREPTLEEEPFTFEDLQAGMKAILPTDDDVLAMFPHPGKFEDNIYRASAKELCDAMPDWTPIISDGQLVLTKTLGPGHTAFCYTSIKPGQIAGGTGTDSIRVTRQDDAANRRTYWFKNKDQDWVTRRVPKDKFTPELAAAHLAAKVEAQVAAFSRPCPDCGDVQVKLESRSEKNPGRKYWKCTVEGQWKGWDDEN